MKKEHADALVRELLALGCVQTPPPVGLTTPNETMSISVASLATEDLVEFLDLLVRRRQKIHGSVDAVGHDVAKAGYEDVEIVIAAVKRVLRDAVSE